MDDQLAKPFAIAELGGGARARDAPGRGTSFAGVLDP